MSERILVHEVTLDGYKATADNRMLDFGTWGSYGIEKLHLTLGKAWEGLVILAHFNVKGEVVATALADEDNMIQVPWEALKENTFAGRIVFQGDMNGARRLTANLNFKVTNHADFVGSDPVPSDDRWNQFVGETKGYRDDAVAAADAAKKSEANVEGMVQTPYNYIDESLRGWLDDHPEATTTVQDGAITEAKINGSFLPWIRNDYVTPEMFGAVGDGVADDTEAVQAAIDYGSKNSINVRFNSYGVYSISGIKIKNSYQNLDFCGCTLKANSQIGELPVLTVQPSKYDSSSHNGFVKNLRIDLNSIGLYGVQVKYRWRSLFDNIIINNPTNNSVGIHVDGGGSCAGNIFSNIRGRGNDSFDTVFLKVDAGDNYYTTIDFVNWQYGLVLNYFSTISNCHGFVNSELLYSESCFMVINSPAIMTNIYPDTQRYAFEFKLNDVAVAITNVIFTFNTSIIGKTVTNNYPPFLFKASSPTMTKKVSISQAVISSPIYGNNSIVDTETKCEINVTDFFVVFNNKTYNIKRPGYEAQTKSNSLLFLSAIRDGIPMCYIDGYNDTVTAIANYAKNATAATWNIYYSSVRPRAGIYPCVKLSSGEKSIIYVIVSDDSNGCLIKFDDELKDGDVVHIQIPTTLHQTSYE